MSPWEDLSPDHLQKLAFFAAVVVVLLVLIGVFNSARRRQPPQPSVAQASTALPSSNNVSFPPNDHDALLGLLYGQQEIRNEVQSFSKVLDAQNKSVDRILSTENVIAGLLIAILGGGMVIWKELVLLQERSREIVHLQDSLRHLYNQLGERYEHRDDPRRG